MNPLLEEFKKIREEFIQVVDKFPKEKRERLLFDQWNLKQVLIHMARWDNCLSDNVEFLLKGKEDDFNASSQELCKDWDWEKTYSEFLKGGERLIKTYEALAENHWTKKFWKDKNSTPEKFLKIVTKHYSEEHLPMVRKILENKIKYKFTLTENKKEVLSQYFFL